MEGSASHQSEEPAAESMESSSKKLSNQRRGRHDDRVEFLLTEAQMIIIQHHLPHLFSLIPVRKSSSRLEAGSKVLEKQSVQFVNRKRGRPEGSLSKSKSKRSLMERKSVRILNKQKKKGMDDYSEQNENQSSSNEASGEEVSFLKDFEFSRSASRFDLRSEKSTRKRQSMHHAPEQVDDTVLNRNEQPEKKEKIHANSAQTRCSKKEIEKELECQKNIQKLTPLQIVSIDVPNRQQQKKAVEKYKNGPAKIQSKVSIKPKSSKKLKQSQKYKEEVQSEKEIDKVQDKKGKEYIIQVIDDVPEQKHKDYCSEELQSKFIQQKFGPQIEILKKLKTHEEILPFLQPVDEKRDGAPDYYATVDDPIDLQTIEFKLGNNIYKDPSFFHADMQKMWNNSKQYNQGNSFMMKVTNRLQKFYFKLKKTSCDKNGKKEKKE